MGIQINGQTDTISSTDGSLNIGGTVTVNVTGDATGLTGTPDITVGAVTASSATISGDLTVNGTTTTLDTTLTEVDKLEVGANNTTVGVAITQSGTGDILRLYDSSTQVVTVTDSGNVGIGTDNPASLLDVQGTSSGGTVINSFYNKSGDASSNSRLKIGVNGASAGDPILQLTNDVNNWYLTFDNSDSDKFKIGTTIGSSQFVINSNGAIGIGTASPQQSNIPSIHLHTNTSDDARIAITTPTKPNSRIGYFGLSDRFGMDVYNGFQIRDASDSYATRFTIDSSGRLLIGSTSSSSSAKLAVNGAVGNPEAFFELNRTDDPTSGQNIGIIEFCQGNAASRLAARIITRRDGGVWGASSLPTRFEFHTCPNGSNTPLERLRIDSNGNVTIPNIPLLKTNMNNVYGSAGSLTASPRPASAILQSSAEIDRGDNGWTTSGSNAYTFVCPVTGIYAVHAHMSLNDITQGNRIIFTMAYTAGGGNLPLDSYVEVMDVNMDDYMNYSYYNTWNFTAGTRVGFGLNGVSGTVSGINSQWGIHLIA